MALSSNFFAFKVQTLENIFGQKAAPKEPEWPSYGNFREVIQNSHFLKKCKGGTKGNFSKSVQKVAPQSSNQYALKAQRLEMILAQTTAPKVPELQSYGNFLEGHSKAPFSEKVQRGDEEKVFQNCPKRSVGFKGPTALWRKCHYPLICINL